MSWNSVTNFCSNCNPTRFSVQLLSVFMFLFKKDVFLKVINQVWGTSEFLPILFSLYPVFHWVEQRDEKERKRKLFRTRRRKQKKGEQFFKEMKGFQSWEVKTLSHYGSILQLFLTLKQKIFFCPILLHSLHHQLFPSGNIHNYSNRERGQLHYKWTRWPNALKQQP